MWTQNNEVWSNKREYNKPRPALLKPSVKIILRINICCMNKNDIVLRPEPSGTTRVRFSSFDWPHVCFHFVAGQWHSSVRTIGYMTALSGANPACQMLKVYISKKNNSVNDMEKKTTFAHRRYISSTAISCQYDRIYFFLICSKPSSGTFICNYCVAFRNTITNAIEATIRYRRTKEKYIY